MAVLIGCCYYIVFGLFCIWFGVWLYRVFISVYHWCAIKIFGKGMIVKKNGGVFYGFETKV